MTDTPRLGLPVIEAAQAQKHVTHNDALMRLDTLVQIAVESRSLTSPPGAPADGDCYIPASGATGAWSGWAGDLVVWNASDWLRLAPKDGMHAWVKAERVAIIFQDGVWHDGVTMTAHGAQVALRLKEESVALSGASIETTDAAFIPSRAIVLGVSSRTTTAITGATSYAVGIFGEVGKFGDLLGIAPGSSNVGVIGPTAFYADTRVRITANGSNFTGGVVRLACCYLELTAPNS